MKGRRKIGKRTGALVLGFAVMFCTMAASRGNVYGALAIDTERTDCMITFTLDVEALDRAGELAGPEAVSPDYEEYYGELAEYLEGNTIQVKLYRTAEVDAQGNYTLLPPWQGIDALKGVETADSSTTAGEWSEWAAAAAEIAVGKEQEDGSVLSGPEEAPEPDARAQISLGADGKAGGRAENLETGLYLVCVEPVDTLYCRYRFVPYLIALPNNYYHPGDENSSEEWIYGDEAAKPVYVGLKPERENRYGDLVIEKTLSSYNGTFKGASFVFEVKAVKDNTLVYSDVVSLTFDGYGTQQVRIQQIPAGAEVTVTEVYSGAGYSPADGQSVKSAVIASEGEAVTVSFENEYNGSLNGGGASVVNHFSYEKDEAGQEGLTWEKQNDSRAGGGIDE